MILMDQVNTEEKNKTFAELIEANKALILKICFFYARTEADRQDLFQDIVLQAWKGFPRFRGESKFSTWLYTVSLNTALTVKRKNKIPFTVQPDDVASEAAQPSDQEDKTRLYAAIEQLNEIEKSIVLLYLDNYAYDEMEKILGISSGALRVKMSRIKQKLKTLIK